MKLGTYPAQYGPYRVIIANYEKKNVYLREPLAMERGYVEPKALETNEA